MKTLFQNVTIYSEKEYNTFLQTHIKKFNFKENFYTISYSLLILLCVIITLLNKEFLLGLFFIIVLISFIFWRLWHPISLVKKERSSKKITNHYKNIYNFYNNYFINSNVKGKCKFYYFKLYKVIENDTNFYLYINHEYAFIISKNGFKIGNCDDFRNFLKKKCLFKYSKSV